MIADLTSLDTWSIPTMAIMPSDTSGAASAHRILEPRWNRPCLSELRDVNSQAPSPPNYEKISRFILGSRHQPPYWIAIHAAGRKRSRCPWGWRGTILSGGQLRTQLGSKFKPWHPPHELCPFFPLLTPS